MLSIDGLNAYYGDAHILFDLAIEVHRGEVVALMGRNGAGKSTTFKAIMGHLPRVRGRLVFNDEELSRLPTHLIARRGLGYVPEERRVFTELTVMENLEVGRQPPRRGAPQWSPEKLFQLFPNLGEMKKRAAGRMSGGEQQMLTIARTLMGNPSCILLDEPSEGLAPLVVEFMTRTIRELKAEGLSVLLSEQNLRFARRVSDRAYVLEKGRIRFQGSMRELATNEEVLRNYLSV